MGDIAQGQQVSKKLPAKQLIPYVLLVVGAVAMAVSFFLPFASAKGDYAEYLKQYGDGYTPRKPVYTTRMWWGCRC